MACGAAPAGELAKRKDQQIKENMAKYGGALQTAVIFFLTAQKVHGDTAKSHNDKGVRSSIYELTHGIAPAEEVTERTCNEGKNGQMRGCIPTAVIFTGYSRSAPPPAKFP